MSDLTVVRAADIIRAAPRDDLVRMVAPVLPDEHDVSGLYVAERRAATQGDDGNTLAGYAAVFNQWTTINSWEGKFRERLSPKCFDKTLKERGDQIKCLFNHGYDPSIGDKPLGKPARMAPDRLGLWTETPFSDTSYAPDIRNLVADGAIDGMSFRFSVVKQEWNEDTEDGVVERTILELRCYEFGPVTFPAYEATTAGIRNAAAFAEWRSNRKNQPEAAGTPDGAAGTSERNDDEPVVDHSAARDKARRSRAELRRYLSKESA